jgi:hypothetical protein
VFNGDIPGSDNTPGTSMTVDGRTVIQPPKPTRGTADAGESSTEFKYDPDLTWIGLQQDRLREANGEARASSTGDGRRQQTGGGSGSDQ